MKSTYSASRHKLIEFQPPNVVAAVYMPARPRLFTQLELYNFPPKIRLMINQINEFTVQQNPTMHAQNADMPSDPHLESQTRILAYQPAFSCSKFVLALME